MVEDRIKQVRAAVAAHLEARGIGDRAFYEEIREGKRDAGPFMVGALAWEQRLAGAGMGDGALQQ